MPFAGQLYERPATLYTRGVVFFPTSVCEARSAPQCDTPSVHTHIGVLRMREYRARSPGCRVAKVASHRVASRETTEWDDTGAGPVGSADIKITGHAAQAATRSCIVVQVQWLHPATTCGSRQHSVCYAGSGEYAIRRIIHVQTCLARAIARDSTDEPVRARYMCLKQPAVVPERIEGDS